jgi:hypothetical protein
MAGAGIGIHPVLTGHDAVLEDRVEITGLQRIDNIGGWGCRL